ncbi:MAG: sulfur reduction protein DsrE [Porphyromonadaceae bacterium]|nr:MAG: sulfur reduction protein DsrE [Porphyromonadaceae bacterium]
MAIIISTNDSETSWNAFRFANFCIGNNEAVKVFLIGKGVEAEQVSDDKFNIKEQMEKFIATKGEILACGTCFKIRNSGGTELCPLSTMNDLYEMVKEADKVITF